MVSIGEILPFLNFRGAEITLFFSAIILLLFFLPTNKKQKDKLGLGTSAIDESLFLIVNLILLSLLLAIFGFLVGTLIDYFVKFFFTGAVTSESFGFFPILIPQLFLTLIFVLMRSKYREPLFIHRKSIPHALGKILSVTVLITVWTLPFFISSLYFNPLYRDYLVRLLILMIVIPLSYLIIAFFGMIDGLFNGYAKWLGIFLLETKNTFLTMFKWNKFLVILPFLVSLLLPFLIFPQVTISEIETKSIDIRVTPAINPNAINSSSKNVTITPYLLRWVIVEEIFNNEGMDIWYGFRNKTYIQNFEGYHFVTFNKTFFQKLNYTISGVSEAYRLGENFITWKSAKVSDKNFSIEISIPEMGADVHINELQFPSLPEANGLICKAKCNEASYQAKSSLYCNDNTRMFGNNILHFWGDVDKERDGTATFLIGVWCE